MPVTRSRTYFSDFGLEDSNNTTGFLFGDEDANAGEAGTTPTAQVGTSDAFPSLFRQQAYPIMVSFLFCFVCLQVSQNAPFETRRSRLPSGRFASFQKFFLRFHKIKPAKERKKSWNETSVFR